ncbi:acyltransferase [Acidisoma cellulosilytica]|uniref:Acyltransferase n=1 Tax=Acidisoma cellulosilyticum TaxID=2802395 RepID=A0A963YYN2_9PROT|nr:acyltransferase [Acidisoma cellulosilyticum]MCB8878633.1 acyltransferase [Acidisoma cellulosilyticum]
MAQWDDPRADLPDLTAARGLLALWVFAYHANLHLAFAGTASFIGRGYLGVDGFFVLSGLVLAHRHPAPVQTVAAYGGFWWRRFVRLYPTALAMLLLLALLFLLAKLAGVHPHQALRASGREFLLQLLLLNGLGFSDGWTWNYPSWSISTEWIGYLLFPAIALGIARLGLRSTVQGLIAMALLLLVLSGSSPSGLNLSYQGALPRFLPEFAAGILLARLVHLGWRPWPWQIIGIAGLVLLTLGIWLRQHTAMGDALVASALWLLLWAMATGPQRLFARLPILMRFGALSYPFYMAYAPVEVIAAHLWSAAGSDPAHWPYLWLVPLFLSNLALAWITAQTIERPALRHLAGRRRDR